MYEEDLLEPASVQYGAWNGTVQADDVDMKHVEEFLGLDDDVYRVLALDITIYAGHQRLAAYAVPAGYGWKELEAITDRGEPILTKRVKVIDYDREGHGDANPPAPLTLPVMSATEYLGHGFKRLHIRLITRSLPPGARLLPQYEEGEE